MTTFPIHITPHHLSLSPALNAFVNLKLAKVPRFASDALAAEIVLRRHHGTAHGKEFSASARIALPGHDIHGSSTHSDLYTAIIKLVSTLASRSRKRKTRMAKSFTPCRKVFTFGPATVPVLSRTGGGKVVAPQGDDPIGHDLHRGSRRKGGQELRAFGFRRQSPISFASNA